MWHISSATIALLVLGALLVILAGFSNGSVPPIGFWGLYGQYILLMAGVTLIIAAAVLFLRERRTHRRAIRKERISSMPDAHYLEL